MKYKKISNDQRKQILEQVKHSRQQGENLHKACAEHGISDKTFYNWSARLREPVGKAKKVKTAKKAFVQEIPIHQPSSQERVMCIIGSSAEIADIIRGIK